MDLTELMWASSTNGELLGECITIPALDALWLHLVVHNSYHIWQGKSRLIQLVDLAQITPKLDNSACLIKLNRCPVYLS